MEIAIGTRFWGTSREKDFPRISAFVESAKKIGPVLVAVNSEEDKISTVELFPDVAFPVTPWGKFVQPLNAIILKAATLGANHLLLASAEFPPTQEQTDILLRHMDYDTLVVGAAFAEHDFAPGLTQEGTGVTVPWNTFALWNLAYLAGVGVPVAGDSPFRPIMAGVEEVCTIAVLQKLYPNVKAKLVKVPGLGGEWNTEGWSDERLAKHRQKIQSKIARPMYQLAWIFLKPPVIEHISVENHL